MMYLCTLLGIYSIYLNIIIIYYLLLRRGGGGKPNEFVIKILTSKCLIYKREKYINKN